MQAKPKCSAEAATLIRPPHFLATKAFAGLARLPHAQRQRTSRAGRAWPAPGPAGTSPAAGRPALRCRRRSQARVGRVPGDRRKRRVPRPRSRRLDVSGRETPAHPGERARGARSAGAPRLQEEEQEQPLGPPPSRAGCRAAPAPESGERARTCAPPSVARRLAPVPRAPVSARGRRLLRGPGHLRVNRCRDARTRTTRALRTHRAAAVATGNSSTPQGATKCRSQGGPSPRGGLRSGAVCAAPGPRGRRRRDAAP